MHLATIHSEFTLAYTVLQLYNVYSLVCLIKTTRPSVEQCILVLQLYNVYSLVCLIKTTRHSVVQCILVSQLYNVYSLVYLIKTTRPSVVHVHPLGIVHTSLIISRDTSLQSVVLIQLG